MAIKQLLEDGVLADDDLGHLGLELGERVLETLDGREVGVILQRLRLDLCVAHALASRVETMTRDW